MSANNILSNWLFDDNIINELKNNLSTGTTSWLNTDDVMNSVANNLGDIYTTQLLNNNSRAYSKYNIYDNYNDNGLYSKGSYYDNSSSYTADIYIKDYSYNAYAEYGNYSDYYDYSNYKDYYNYYNYSKTMVYFYWTKNNDGTNKMTGSETGLMSPWAMAVQMNNLITLVNKYAGKSIGAVTANSPMLYSKYNELASALGVAQLSEGTPITVQQFYNLQVAFNNKGYYTSG